MTKSERIQREVERLEREVAAWAETNLIGEIPAETSDAVREGVVRVVREAMQRFGYDEAATAAAAETVREEIGDEDALTFVYRIPPEVAAYLNRGRV